MRTLARLALVASAIAPLAALYACQDDDASPGTAIPEADAGTFSEPDATSPTRDAAIDDKDSGSTSPDASVTDAGEQTDAATPDAASNCPFDPDSTVTAQIRVTADDYLTLWVNGVLIDDKASQWPTVDTKTVTLFRNPSRKNVIAIEARNAQNAGGFDRGLLVDLAGIDAGADAGPDGGTLGVVTDLSWKIVSETSDGGLPDGGLPDGGGGAPAWVDVNFDDSAWHAPVDEGPHGMSPWGNIFQTSAAHWLWSYDSSTAGNKPMNESVYFRKTFYLDMKGNATSAPPACE